jgi:hypothetical protein
LFVEFMNAYPVLLFPLHRSSFHAYTRSGVKRTRYAREMSDPMNGANRIQMDQIREQRHASCRPVTKFAVLGHLSCGAYATGKLVQCQ